MDIFAPHCTASVRPVCGNACAAVFTTRSLSVHSPRSITTLSHPVVPPVYAATAMIREQTAAALRNVAAAFAVY